MKPEEQQIAIAEACGWTIIPVYGDFIDPVGFLPAQEPQHKGRRVGLGSDGPVHILPDYLNDLNAMHEAEKVLNDDQYYDWSKDKHTDMSYNGHLFRLVDNATPVDRPCRYYSATAEQRAEAFLKTLNLWIAD